MVSTNFSKTSINSTNFGSTDPDATDVLLLQSGDELLLQNGTDSLLLNFGLTIKSTNFTKQSINSTNYS